MNKNIAGKPTLYLSQIFNKNEGGSCAFPLTHEKCFYFYSARYALSAGIKALDIGSNDAILLPSYNCGIEVDAVLYHNISPVYYKINKNLLVDIDDLLRKITKNVKAILITHFLGFPQPIDEIKKICIENNLFLIEDCAHAFLSTYNNSPLGSFGDISVFSLLKTLPIPNGGALVINNKDIKCRQNSEEPSLFSTLFFTTELLKQRTTSNNHLIKKSIIQILNIGFFLFVAFLRFFLAVFRKLFHKKGLYFVRPDSYFFIPEICSWGIARSSKNIIYNSDFAKIKNTRRRNFEYLLDYFINNERAILPIKKLPPGMCPLFFPIIVESAEKRDVLYKTLKSRGITTHDWWKRSHPEVPWDKFPDAAYLKQRLFGLPIHQDLTLDHINRIIDEFEKVYQSI